MKNNVSAVLSSNRKQAKWLVIPAMMYVLDKLLSKCCLQELGFTSSLTRYIAVSYSSRAVVRIAVCSWWKEVLGGSNHFFTSVMAIH